VTSSSAISSHWPHCRKIAPHVRLNSRVTAIVRRGHDKMKTPGRELAPLVLRLETPDGQDQVLAKAVLDASGTWSSPNPLGADGLPALGELAAGRRVFYGIPDVFGEITISTRRN
jgi:hypothetical protein